MTAPSRPDPAERRPRARALDLVALSALFVLALLGFQSSYGGLTYLVTGVAALALALIISLVGARWRWGPLPIALAVIVVHLVLGTPFAAPSHGYFGVIPSLGSLLELLTAPALAWKVMITMAPPVGVAQGVLVVIWLSMLLLGIGAFTVVLRTRRYLVAWLFPVALLALSILLGTVTATAPVTRGVLFGAISVAWVCWRFESDRLDSARSTIISDTVRPGSWKNPVLRRRVIGGALILALSAGVAIGLQRQLAPAEGQARYALRDEIKPPLDLYDYTSPLAQFRGYLKNKRDVELFSVSGVPRNERMTLAVMDSYDGEVFNVAGGTDKDSDSGAFLRTAAGVDFSAPAPGSRTATVTVADYDRVWMPAPGASVSRVEPTGPGAPGIAENLYVNRTTQTLVDRAGLRDGDAYQVTYAPYAEPTPQQKETLRFDDVDLPPLPTLDPQVTAKAMQYIDGMPTDYLKMQTLTQAIKDQASFTHGLEGETPSMPGHGEARLVSMLQSMGVDESDPAGAPQGLIGDQEQLAALTVLLARSAGIPARVVMGFAVPDTEEGTHAITGNDVTAWVEVKFEGVGWVRFDPTPDVVRPPTAPEDQIVDQPKPQVAQPPPPPIEPPRLPPVLVGDSGPRPDPVEEPTPAWLVAVLAVSIPVVLVLLWLLSIVVAKAVRRGRRRSRGGATARLDGGWREIVDWSTDLGHPPPARSTRPEIVAAWSGVYPAAHLDRLAAGADLAVFGPDAPPEHVVEEYWADVRRSREGMGAAVSGPRRFLARISLRSLRPRRRSDRPGGRKTRTRTRTRKDGGTP